MNYICHQFVNVITCIAINGGPDLNFYNTNPQYEPPKATLSIKQREDVYRSMGMVTNYEYFCRNRNIHPMDKEMCARGLHR